MNVIMGDAPAIGDAIVASTQVPYNYYQSGLFLQYRAAAFILLVYSTYAGKKDHIYWLNSSWKKIDGRSCCDC